MRYLSVCSGIEAATVAWHPLGWEPVAFSEIEKFPSAVLAHHYPHVPNLGDMTKILESEVLRGAAVDLLVGGTPCQSFSVAGLRKGLADPRGNLALVYLGLVDALRPRWVVRENVPGVLSSNGGRDFGAFLGALGELGYGFAYRVLDAQYFGLAQRRKRVFVVGCAGGWQRAGAVLLERHGLRGDPAPSREPGQRVAGSLTTGASGRGGWRAGADEAAAGQLIAFDPTQITSGENRSNPQPGDPCHTLAKAAHAPVIAFNPQAGGKQTSLGFDPSSRTAGALVAHQIPAIAFQERGREGGRSLEVGGELAYALTAPAGGGRHQEGNILTPDRAVRRLTPRECERLQGFPDDYTLAPYRGKAAADGPRYKALGNSMAVPVMAWIGRRIAEVDALG